MIAKIQHIQGIRALAIVAVVLFHFIPWHFPNGYLGVDTFFVLSGYLMAKIMSKEKKLDWNVVSNFWYRRIKRIFPMYYFVILLSAASLFIFPMPNLPTIIDSMINALFFSTNLQPFTGFDYFLKLAAVLDLFTHTWSLCVEIQFYLFFPMLYYINKLVPAKLSKFNIPWIIAGITSIVFYFNVSEHIAFNCMLSRLWQFVVGILSYDLSGEKKSTGARFI